MQGSLLAEYWITRITGSDASTRHTLMNWGENVLPAISNRPLKTPTPQG